MSVWESQYREAASQLASPENLDERILQQASQYKPAPSNSRLASGAAGSFAAVAVLVLLIHPARYLGALTPGGSTGTGTDPLENWQMQQKAPTPVERDQWFALRGEVRAGNYVTLCEQWRKEQRGVLDARLPADLARKARRHCRLLPTP
ncbi:hypothetical protein [Microbulbifer zhoushanensis]|uniref:hypothetical protein n=1 Tax=Microbulbifer zhoushanensis TaxID=2904254 RepID=UPI001F18E802|nr:hypothetical protein [Microbulbifer zhoushanensis]